jgi:amino acid transporter
LQLLATVLVAIGGTLLISGALFAGSAQNMQPLFDHGLKGFLGVLVMVPFMFVGFDVIPQSAEEIDIPFSDIGKMLMLSIGLAVAWYILIILAVSMGLSADARAVSNLPTADATVAVFAGAWAGNLLVIAGIGGILTSWNAFLIGGSRAIYALAKAGQLPAALGHLHPRFNTPHRAILLIGLISVCAPLLGRPALVWLVDAGGLGIVIAYAFVAASFLVLRRREPDMLRPYSVRHPKFTGWAALLLSVAIASLYLPWSPAALIWPWEWLIVIGWAVLGLVLLLFAPQKGT